MKEYFSHDYNPTSDPKMAALVADYGAAGYGIWWTIVEQLHQHTEHKLELKPYMFKAIAKQVGANAEQVRDVIKSCIHDYDLLIEDDGHFYSERVNRNIQQRNELSEKRSKAGKAGANAKQMLSNSQANAKQNEAKEKEKEKEKGNKKEKEKEKENGETHDDLPDDFDFLKTPEERFKPETYIDPFDRKTIKTMPVLLDKHGNKITLISPRAEQGYMNLKKEGKVIDFFEYAILHVFEFLKKQEIDSQRHYENLFLKACLNESKVTGKTKVVI